MSSDVLPVDQLVHEDKERIRYHLGYIASATAASLTLGIPNTRQTGFVLERAMEILTNGYSIARVRSILCALDRMEGALLDSIKTLGISSVGELHLHPLKARGKLQSDSIEREYYRWTGRLADIFGVIRYPYSERNQRRGPGSNVSMG